MTHIKVQNIEFAVETDEEIDMLEELADELTEEDFADLAANWGVNDLDSNPLADEKIGLLVTVALYPTDNLSTGVEAENG